MPRTRRVSKTRIIQFYRRNGCIREPRQERLDEGSASYKKGWEVRITLESKAEVAELQDHLRCVSLRPGKPYKKSHKWVQPIYGVDAVDSIKTWSRRPKRARRKSA